MRRKIMRTNVGFLIIASEKNSSGEEVVMGMKQVGDDYQYVTWICYNGNNYNHGHYFTNDFIRASQDFRARWFNIR